MKTITTKISVFCLIFLFYSKTKAQEEVYAYRGGNADGFATETLENATCSTPFHHYAYFGGTGDGGSLETIADNATCGTPYHHFAYFGGNGDGATVETLETLNCATPYHFYAYFGGAGDGFASEKTEDVCPSEAPVVEFIADELSVCVNQNVLFTDTSTNTPTYWTWTFEGGTPTTAVTKTATVFYTEPGEYSVTLVAGNFVGNNTLTKTAYITVVEDCGTLATGNTEISKIQLYPNPTKGLLYLKSDDPIRQIEIFDLTGRKVNTFNVNQKEVNLNLQSLNAGLYLIKTMTEKGIQTHKVIKKD